MLLFVFIVSPSAQLLEQTARLQSLSDTLDRLKVNPKESRLRKASEGCEQLGLKLFSGRLVLPGVAW